MSFARVALQQTRRFSSSAAKAAPAPKINFFPAEVRVVT